MQNYSFAPASGPPREGQKNYVFVDEHNRHKRLKVMRACNGCRKRKIKCDAATTNTWPCSACTRLKLVCVPPTIAQDGDFLATGQALGQESHNVGTSHSVDASRQNLPMQQNLGSNSPNQVGGIAPYNSALGIYSQYVPSQNQHSIYSEVHPQLTMPHPYHQQAVYPTTPSRPLANAESGVFLDPEQSTAEGLSEALGELKIDETGIAPYIRRQRKGMGEPEAPVDDESDDKLPPLSTGAGSKIRIPPELMPSDEEALKYFDIYFSDIHPYVPVVHRSHLYRQWRQERASISPLLLEAIFACAARMSDDPAQGRQWLAMANRHELSFMDVPRLSTIQALLLLLKARESAPKKGYYYRSWQTVKTAVSMAKDLDLHEHYGMHQEERTCELDPIECLVQTRVWQTLLVVEVMVGAPQGRSDYGVDPETVDMRPLLDIPNMDQFEIDRSRQFSYFVRNAHHIRLIADIYHKIKRQKDWGADPRLVENNPLFSDWLRNLPPDLQVNYPVDGSPPWLSSHFVGNMHSHCHLGIIMLHRPQLLASKSFSAGGSWKTHMALCYSSAKSLCRLQEAILARFGPSGLLYMQRGINFSIYCILTCTMIHLVAITSPDPDFHADARDYFTRHMRILEQCAAHWLMPEIQAQIDSLRLAFSADINRPFELKPTFPYGSPSESYHPSPPMDSQYQPHFHQVPAAAPSRLGYGAHPISPPISSGTEDSKPDSPHLQSLGMIADSQTSDAPLGVPLVDENSWDPTRIINQWDMAFSVAPSTSSTNSPPMPMNNPAMGAATSLPNHYPIQYAQAGKMASVAPSQPAYGPQPVMITARDWQQSVASVFDPQGLKRRWNYSVDLGSENASKRAR
ncbi:transcriptional regulator family: Fungal Specific TF [Paecilomyces variotii]|nr:transcriptional regulator family: Fungal Specific TF [Paecilomyces variotii]